MESLSVDMNAADVWLPVKGYESTYLVSEYGQVRSLITNRILKDQPLKRGHIRVPLNKNKRGKLALVHRLVAEAFIGAIPFDGACVLHLDDDPTNNHFTNLK